MSPLPAPSVASSFNRERQASYTFEVRATDGGRADARLARATVTVVIDDANDHAPVLSRYPFTARVPAYTEQGTELVTVHATDDDLGANGQVTYRLVELPSRQDRSPAGQYHRLRGMDTEYVT